MPRGNITPTAIQLCIKWCGGNINRLFSGGIDMQINAYDVQKFEYLGGSDSGKRQNDINRELLGSQGTTDKVYHTKDITDLLTIKEMGLIASASIDSNMCLWSMETLKGKSIHEQGHTKPIYSLEWYEDSRLILSAGVDHDIFIWNPICKDSIFTLKGHNHSLVGVKWLKGTNQIVSADISGMIKIWDVRTFTCVQSFNCPPLNEIHAFALTRPPKRIIAAGR